MSDPLTADLAAVYLLSGTENSFSAPVEMIEVDDTASGHRRYTVYEVADPDKRYLCVSTVPTFQADSAGNGSFSPVTGQIEYPGGRLILSSPRGPTDRVQLVTGKYYTPAKVLGGTTSKTSRKNILEMFHIFGEKWPRRHVAGKDFSISLDNYVLAACAELITSGGNPNSHIVLWHEDGGDPGNDITIALSDPGASSGLEIAVSGTDIVATLEYEDGIGLVTTAQDLVVALEADPFVRALGARAKLKPGETGTGIIAAMQETALAGGLDPEDYTGKDNVCLVIVYKDEASDKRVEGYCWIGDVNTDLAPGKLAKETLDIQGHGKLYRRV